MNEVVIGGKTFRVLLSEEKILSRVADLGKQIVSEYAGKDYLAICVLKGGFIFAADLIRNMQPHPVIQFVRLSSYGDGMESSGKMREMLGIEEDVSGRHILIIEDIVDNGNTLAWLREKFLSRHAASVKMVTLLFKPDAYKGLNPPEYIGFEIPNAFVIGYGLDFGDEGRGLRSIYSLNP